MVEANAAAGGERGGGKAGGRRRRRTWQSISADGVSGAAAMANMPPIVQKRSAMIAVRFGCRRNLVSE